MNSKAEQTIEALTKQVKNLKRNSARHLRERKVMEAEFKAVMEEAEAVEANNELIMRQLRENQSTVKDLNKRLAHSRSRFAQEQRHGDRARLRIEQLENLLEQTPPFAIETVDGQILIKIGKAPPVQYRGHVITPGTPFAPEPDYNKLEDFLKKTLGDQD